MSTHADKAGLTSSKLPPNNVTWNGDGVSADEAVSERLPSFGDEAITSLGKPVHISCCPTGTLEFATSLSKNNENDEQKYDADSHTAITHTINAMTKRMSVHPPKILILNGSLRKTSASRKVGIEAGRILSTYGADVKLYDPAGLPLFDMDLDASEIPKVEELRNLVTWCEGMIWVSPEIHGNFSAVFKNQVDWMPLSTGAVRPTQGKTCAVMQVEAGSQSFNTVNNLRVLGRWMRMVVIPNQLSIPKAYTEFDEETGGLKESCSSRNRLVDVVDELLKFTLLLRDQQPYLVKRYSEEKTIADKHLVETTPVTKVETLKALESPIILDVRSTKERDNEIGGKHIDGSVHVPLNMNNEPQSNHTTTKEEFQRKLLDAGIILPTDDNKDNISFIAHCTKGGTDYIGRGARAAALLRDLGYNNAYNGGSADEIRNALS